MIVPRKGRPRTVRTSEAFEFVSRECDALLFILISLDTLSVMMGRNWDRDGVAGAVRARRRIQLSEALVERGRQHVLEALDALHPPHPKKEAIYIK